MKVEKLVVGGLGPDLGGLGRREELVQELGCELLK